jgi:hypothetical protein
METNTPATPSMPSGDPIGVSPVQDVQDVQDNPVEHDLTTDHPRQANATVNATVNEAVNEAVNPTVKATTDNVGTLARPKGPNATAVVLGLAAIVLAGLLIADETMGLKVDWSRLGPGAIVGIGLVLVVLGAIGLVRRHDDL